MPPHAPSHPPGAARFDDRLWRALVLLDVALAGIEESLETQRRWILAAEFDVQRAYV